MGALLRRIFLENFVLKALALALAVSLVLVKREDQTTVVTISVRVRVTHPENRVLTSPPVDKVKITVEGKYNRLRQFEADNVAAVDVNLSGYEEGQVTFDPELFRLPPDLEVRAVRPAAMLVRFENRVQRTIPVEAALEGEAQTGYRLTQVTVEPPAVTVEGAESVVRALERIETERISLVGRNQTTVLAVSLQPPPAYAGYRERGRRYEVTAVIEEKRSTRMIAGVQVEVRDLPDGTPGYEVSPAAVDVTLNGPVGLLTALEPEELSAFVSAAGLGPNNVYTRAVRLDPYEGLVVSDIEPTQVTLVRLPPPRPPPDAGPSDAGPPDAAPGGRNGKKKPDEK